MVALPATVKVRVKKWDVFQPKKDVKRPSWFRIDYQMIDDADFFALEHGEFRAWIYTLSQCCRKNSATVTLNFDHAARVCNVSRDDVFGCIQKLTESGHIEADGTFTIVKVTDAAVCDRKRALQDETVHTRQDRTEQDETKNLPAKVAKAPISAATWLAYAQAWNRRHGGTPLRDAQANSQLKKFVERVGQADAPAIAAFYVTHNDTFYVKNRHPINLLLTQVERIRADWQAGGMITHSEAKQAEVKQGLVNSFGALIAEAEARDGKR